MVSINICFSPIFLTIILFLLNFSTGRSAGSKHDSPFMSSRKLNLQLEEIIKSMNLLPENEEKINYGSSGLVENTIRLQISGGTEPSIQDLGHHAGYYRLPRSKDARMFYFFFESRNKESDPVAIWLHGGPGCSGELPLFYENGPFQITNNLSLMWNDFGWDKVSNLIYVDQPIGTGFSYTSDDSDIRHNEEAVSNDLYDFLQAFFKEHPQYTKNDFYITGESYAGHYIPALATRVQQGNTNKEGVPINLKGVAIGNGLTNPKIQYKAYSDYAFNMKLITQSDRDNMNGSLLQCEQAIKLCGPNTETSCVKAYVVCNTIFNKIVGIAKGINFFDIRKKCEGGACYDFSNMKKFLNMKIVRDALGVGDISYAQCNATVYVGMVTDWIKNLDVGIPALLDDGIKVLVYAGEYDLICNWLGNWRWVHAMEWSGQKEFASAPTTSFVVDGVEAGLQTTYGPLTFLKVHNAGHMVPMDQPKASLEIISRWMQASNKLNYP